MSSQSDNQVPFTQRPPARLGNAFKETASVSELFSPASAAGLRFTKDDQKKNLHFLFFFFLFFAALFFLFPPLCLSSCFLKRPYGLAAHEHLWTCFLSWQQNNEQLPFFFFHFFESVPENCGNGPALFLFLSDSKGSEKKRKSFELAAREKNQTAKNIIVQDVKKTTKKKNSSCSSFFFFFVLLITGPIIKRTSWKIAGEHEFKQLGGASQHQKTVNLEPVVNKVMMRRQHKDNYDCCSTCGALTDGATIPA